MSPTPKQQTLLTLAVATAQVRTLAAELDLHKTCVAVGARKSVDILDRLIDATAQAVASAQEALERHYATPETPVEPENPN